jgi:hypothetical protein
MNQVTDKRTSTAFKILATPQKKNFITNASFSGCHNSNSYTQQLAQTLLATLPRKDPWSTISIPATLALVNVATTPEINAETATLAT